MTNIDPVSASVTASQTPQVVPNAPDLKVASIFKRIFCSPLFWAVATLGAVCLLQSWTITAAAVAGVACVVIACRKRFVYEVTLSFGYLMNKIVPHKWPAYNKITEELYLGRLPLKNSGDHITLQKEGIGAVLSMVEKFENHSTGIFSDPVRPDDWKALGVEHCQVETPDFHPVSVESFQRAVAFVDVQTKLGKKVYIHCKAGRGRSAAALVAFLRAKRPQLFASTPDCVAFVKNRRPLVSLRSDKIATIEAFLQS